MKKLDEFLNVVATIILLPFFNSISPTLQTYMYITLAVAVHKSCIPLSYVFTFLAGFHCYLYITDK